MIRSPIQQTEFDCGIVAVMYFMGLKGGFIPDRVALAFNLRTTPDQGTSHDAIREWLSLWSSRDPLEHIGPIESAPIPCIVNYWDEDDGHYGVVVAKTDDLLFLFNPQNGEVERWDVSAFNAVFYSKRYGAKWSISL